ncbi:MAG: hypothetical protein ACE5J5_02645 [Candidatus Hydrothermarchaeales archaeon]
MRQIEMSEETFRKLIELKNHWTFQHRKVTNKDVINSIEKAKMDIYGYNSTTPLKDLEKIANSKTKEELQAEMERFAGFLKELLTSGYDFEPEYTIDEHIKKMIGVINEGEDILTPIF